MYTLIVVMICSMTYIKYPCVIHTYYMLCTGVWRHGIKKSQGKWYW